MYRHARTTGIYVCVSGLNVHLITRDSTVFIELLQPLSSAGDSPLAAAEGPGSPLPALPPPSGQQSPTGTAALHKTYIITYSPGSNTHINVMPHPLLRDDVRNTHGCIIRTLWYIHVFTAWNVCMCSASTRQCTCDASPMSKRLKTSWQ